MSYQHLLPVLDPKQFNLFLIRRADERFTNFAKKTAEACDHTCQYCFFKAEKYMEVINIDGDYMNNAASNMTLACPFCTQYHFLFATNHGLGMGDGQMIYLPTLTQEQLNALCHVIFCSLVNQTDYAPTAQSILNGLQSQAAEVEALYGKGMSNPAFMMNVLIDTPFKAQHDVFQQILASVRFLPSLDAYRERVADWSDEALARMASYVAI